MKKENKFCYALKSEKLGEGIVVSFPSIFQYGGGDLKPFYDELNCNLVETISFYDAKNNVNLEFIVDEEGTFVVGNPIYLVDLCIGGAKYTFNIVGDFAIAQSIEVNSDYRFSGFDTPEDVMYLLEQYEFNAVIKSFVK